VVDKGVRWTYRAKSRLGSPGPFVFVACMPRTGSTFLTNALSEVTGFPLVDLRFTFAWSEVELYMPRMVDAYAYGTVSQEHVRATQANLNLMRDLGIRPVILVRDLADVTVSVREYLLDAPYTWPTLITSTFLESDESTQYDQIIDLGLPWFIAFYVSWYKATSESGIDALWVKYDDNIADWPKTMIRILEFYDLSVDPTQVSAALERVTRRKERLRFNKGVAGRGRDRLTDVQLDRIAAMTRFYPEVDFSMIGIGRDDQGNERPSNGSAQGWGVPEG
jgi:hypothetical protein